VVLGGSGAASFVKTIIMKPLVIPLVDRKIIFTEVNLTFYECEKNIHLKYHNTKKLKLHKYGDKNFCKFRIDKQFYKNKGIYCYAINDTIVYVGRCINSFYKRFNAGYGHICPRNCFTGGRPTNCRINALIEQNKASIRLGLFNMTNNNDICALEEEILLLHGDSLIWNIQKK
jgi:hypothetical protein